MHELGCNTTMVLPQCSCSRPGHCHACLQVATTQSSGEIVFQDVFMFSHQSPDETARFDVLTLENGQELMATVGHYIWATPLLPSGLIRPSVSFQQDAAIVAMGKLKPGDFVWVAPQASGLLVPISVKAKSYQIGRGLYNPHTASGTILVNDVAALTFTTMIPPSLKLHAALTTPTFLLYQVFPSWLSSALNANLLNSKLTTHIRTFWAVTLAGITTHA